MKKFLITSIMVALFATGTALIAQESQNEYLGLPGDNLNLYAVMRLFQESKTLEEFERRLNDQNSTINNLDLNGDNLVDYIKVIDNADGDVHNIVLQDAVSPVQNQDVAVFTVQRFNNGQVFIQLTGDEALYGRNYIVEPIYNDANIGETANPGYTGYGRPVSVTYIRTTPFEIAGWPLIRFIFHPSYVIWRSSWYWGYYPGYWHPWRPFSWNYYYGYNYNWNRDYYRHYHITDYHRYDRWNDNYYRSRRSFSPDVHHKIEIGDYKSTYSHPEQRRDGESVFAEKHPDQYRRLSHYPSVNNRDMTQRPGSTVTNRSYQSPGNRNTSTQRQPGSINDRSNTNQPSGNNPATNRRQSTPGSNQSVTNPPSDRSPVTSGRPSHTVTDKAMMNAPSGTNTNANRTPDQTKKPIITPSDRKDNKKVRSEAPSKRDNSQKQPDKKQPDPKN